MRWFIVQHGLDAFQELPNYIWNTDPTVSQIPHNYQLVQPGDLWIGYAFTTNDKRERRLSLITGFFECVSKAEHRDAPPPVESPRKAWFIEGKEYGEQPKNPVEIRHFEEILKRRLFRNQAIIPIFEREFYFLREHTFGQ